MRSRHALVLAMLLLAGPDACARGGAGPKPQRIAPEPVILHVINQHPLDMKVFVLHGAERTRIGTATALGTTRFRLDPNLIRGLGDVRFYAEAIGSSGRVSTELLVLHPGDAVDWQLAYDLDHSLVLVQ